MHRDVILTLVIALLSAALIALTGGQAATYQQPFALGPSGGDQYNYIQAEQSGSVTVARAYPNPGGISCSGLAGYARLEVLHEATEPVDEVVIAYTDAAVDPYTFVIADVRTSDGEYIGSRQVRGLLAGDGELTVPVDWPQDLLEEVDADTLTIQFGLQLSGACPSVDAGTLTFTSVTVHHEVAP